MIDPDRPDYANTPVSSARPYFGYTPEDPSNAPVVTIVTPFYNTGAIFHQTAASILGQSFQQWEWLIVNDGSSDIEALEILKAYRQRDPRIQVIDHPINRGLSASRNTGIQAAKAQYVVLIDSDDLLEPTAVEKWFWSLESYPEYSFTNGYTVGFGSQEYLWSKGFETGKDFLKENQVDSTCMLRKTVHRAVGGYDETNRGGLEDWDFWLRCASYGYWGGTVPEYLDWYRRRDSHADRWSNWDYEKGHANFRTKLRQRYPQLWQGGFQQIQLRWHMPNEIVPDEISCENRLRKEKPRLLLLIPWMTFGGADKFNLDLVDQMSKRGWQISIAATAQGDQSWLPEFARFTPDIFILSHFLRLVDYPRFLRYLIRSRQVDLVLISNSELSYLLLPYLRHHAPEVTFVDFCHMEEEEWKNGGYPRMSVEYQELLDYNLVSSGHLKEWMVERSADRERISVCYTGIDPDLWRSNPKIREDVRRELRTDSSLPVIIYVARICPQKQPVIFAKTMLRLREEGLHFAAWVAGDGPDLDRLRSFLEKHRLDSHVRLLGAVSNQRVHDLMMAADIFFLPSKWEGIALTFYEAMAGGLPVIGARVGGQPELVTPECGFLIHRGDEEKEVQLYTDCLAQSIGSPERARQMGNAGRERITAHFRLEQMGEQIDAFFRRAAALHVEQPRPLAGPGLARVCASEAVEYMRLYQLADQLWAERNGLHNLWSLRTSRDWRSQLYMTLYRLHEPYYRWYSQRGWKWLTPIREIVKKALFQKQDS